MIPCRADPGFSERWIEGHQLAAAALGKPLVLEEFGKIATGTAANLTRTRDPVYSYGFVTCCFFFGPSLMS
jgi:hypothetical protein